MRDRETILLALRKDRISEENSINFSNYLDLKNVMEIQKNITKTS